MPLDDKELFYVEDNICLIQEFKKVYIECKKIIDIMKDDDKFDKSFYEEVVSTYNFTFNDENAFNENASRISKLCRDYKKQKGT